MYRKVKKRIFEIIQAGKDGDIISKIFDFFIVFLILINVVTIIIETFDITPREKMIIKNIELPGVIKIKSISKICVFFYGVDRFVCDSTILCTFIDTNRFKSPQAFTSFETFQIVEIQ